MDFINDILTEVSSFVWGPWMAMILLGAGLVLTLRTLFVQVRGFAHGVGIATGKYDDPNHKGQLTHFQALSAALSATIGIGNIAGVAIGIYYGGPGAIFWMWVTAFFGMAIKYAECTLAIKYRKIDPDGNVRGGPMYYIELGVGKKAKVFAWLFALFTAVAAFGAGNMVQSNTMALSLVDAFEVGWETVPADNLEAEHIRVKLDAYNEATVDVTALRRYRADLQDRLETARARGTANLSAIEGEIERTVEKLGYETAQLDAMTTELKELRFVLVGDAGAAARVYPADDPRVRDAEDGRVCELRVVNEPFNMDGILFIQTKQVGQVRWLIGILVAFLAGLVLIGGIRRIGHVASYLVPFMSVVYVASALVVILLNIGELGDAFRLIFYHAFNPTAVVGGSVSGATLWLTFSWGLRRGLFSNEAGQGSAAMAHSAAKVEEPVREGLVAMLGPFIDTIVICTMTALVIIMSGLWASGDNGAVLTMNAFNHELPIYGRWMVVIGVMLFAFSTVLAWSYYGEKGIEYIGGRPFKTPYKYLYVVFTLLGARFDLQAVWSYADTANGLMAVPNLIALVVLSGVVTKMTGKYMDEKANGLHIPYKELMRQQQLPPSSGT
jgi:Na+/alanine symporter